MPMTFQEIAEKVDRSTQYVARYIYSLNQPKYIDKTKKPYLVDDRLANLVIDYFDKLDDIHNPQPRERDSNSNFIADNQQISLITQQNTLIEHYQSEIDYLRRQNERLQASNQSLIDSVRQLSATNALISTNNHHLLVADNPNEPQKNKDKITFRQWIGQLFR